MEVCLSHKHPQWASPPDWLVSINLAFPQVVCLFPSFPFFLLPLFIRELWLESQFRFMTVVWQALVMQRWELRVHFVGTEAKPETCTTGCLLRNVLSVHRRYQSLCFVVSRRKSLVPEQGSGLSLFALFLMVLMDAVSVCTSVPSGCCPHLQLGSPPCYSFQPLPALCEEWLDFLTAFISWAFLLNASL